MRMAKPKIARNTTARMFGQNGVAGHSNQMERRPPAPGSKKRRGINIRVLRMPTTANISDTLAAGLIQWLLIIRCEIANNGAVDAAVSKNAYVAMR